MSSDAATNQSASPAYSWRALMALLLFATLVRGGALWAWHDRLTGDPDAYREWARNLAMHGAYAADGYLAYRPPLYPLMLVATGAYDADRPLLAVRWHLILGVLAVWETARLGARWRLGRWSLLAGGWVAIDPILLNQSSLIMTETLATLLAVTALGALADAWERPSAPRGLWCGAVLALCCLCRPTFLPFAALASLALFAWRNADIAARSVRRRLLATSCCVVMLASILGAWSARNYRWLGKPVLGTTHGGYTLYLGNNRHYYEFMRSDAQPAVYDDFVRHGLGARIERIWLQAGVVRARFPGSLSVWIAQPGGAPHPEIAADEALCRAALESIAADPGGFARASLYRVRRFWGLVPYEPAGEPALRHSVGAWYAALFALALVGSWQLARTRRIWQTPWLFGLLLVGTFMAVHTVYWTDMRMRAPVTPVICLAAAVGAEWLIGRRRHSASPENVKT